MDDLVGVVVVARGRVLNHLSLSRPPLISHGVAFVLVAGTKDQSNTSSIHTFDSDRGRSPFSMANANNFSVFPPPRVPRIALPNPHNRKPSLKTVPTTDTFKESVVIALEEIPMPQVPLEHAAKVHTHSPASSPALQHGNIPPPPPLPKAFQSQSETHTKEAPSTSNHGSPEPESIASSDTLVREEEAVVPIRSMFPVYNPNVPLSQQTYYPQRPVTLYNPQQQAGDLSRANARSMYAPSIHGSVISPTNHASVVDVPLDVLSYREPTFSSPKELEKLWEATQNTEPNTTTSSFDLEIGRVEDAIFTFGSSPDVPFYTITTYDTSEISITKSNPRKRNVVCDIVLSAIEPPSRRLPPNDGLVSFVFPKMAAMLAINQSTALAEEYSLSQTDQDELQQAAIKRAASQEASYLRWNEMEKRYELEHPAIARRNRNPNFVTSPQSPQGSAAAVLHITVATSNQSLEDQPIIIVTYPAAVLRSSPAASPSLNIGGDVPLASLDFNTNTLHVEANNILELMPSLFAVDSIISAIVSVAIADHEANAAMGGMPIWVPRKPRLNESSWTGSQSPGTPRTGAFYATIAEREEAEQEARIAARSHKKSIKSTKTSAKSIELPADEPNVEASRTWYGKSKAKKQKKRKQIVIGEFDLEKLGHYQSGSRQGQELPAVTRGALSMMVSSLKFITWLLTMMVQFLSWILISVTRGVTSEKF